MNREQSTTREAATHVDEFLQILVKICKVLLPFLVVCNELLLPLQQLLTLLLELLSLHSLVVDARNHQRVLIVIGVFGMLGKEFIDGYERELLVGVAAVESTHVSTQTHT